MFKKLVYGVVIACLNFGVVIAEPKKESTLLVTGSVIKSQRAASVLTAHTVTRDDIERANFYNTVDILRTVPGINVTQQGGHGGLSFISMRGGEPNFTSVIIDGVRVNDPTNSRGGGFDFAGLDVHLIEKIEVYFGGYSSVFGSEALGGVISITTLGSSDVEQVNFSAELGEQSARAGSFHVSKTLADVVDVSFAGAYNEGGDFVEGDSLQRRQFIFKIQPHYSGRLDWALSLLNSSGDASSFPEDSGGDQLAIARTPEKRDFKQNNIAASINFSVSDDWAISLAASQARHDEEIDNPGIAAGVINGIPPLLSDSYYQRRDINLTNTVSISSDVTMGLGFEATQEDGRFDSIIDFGFPIPASFSLQRDTYAIFGELLWQANKNVTLMAGLRHDDAEGINETTARLITNYKQPSAKRLFSFQYSEGFKLPSFFALGHPLVGNANLKPELSKNFAIDMIQHFLQEKVTVELSLFRNKFKDLVDFDPILFTNVNRSSVISEGATLSLLLKPNKSVSVNSHITYTNHKTDSGVKLRRRPEWAGGTALNWQVQETLNLNIQGKYVGSFFDNSIPTGLIKMDDYTDFDIALKKIFSKNVNISFIVNNIFNNGYQEMVGFSNIRRQARLVASLNF